MTNVSQSHPNVLVMEPAVRIYAMEMENASQCLETTKNHAFVKWVILESFANTRRPANPVKNLFERNGFSILSKVKFLVNDGYALEFIRKPWNEYQEACLNGGSCRNITLDGKGYKCDCSPGFEGEVCEKIHPCHPIKAKVFRIRNNWMQNNSEV